MKKGKEKKKFVEIDDDRFQNEMMFRTAYIHFCVRSSTYFTCVVDQTYVIYWTAKITAIALLVVVVALCSAGLYSV